MASRLNLRNIWGVAKIYETYVGAKSFQGPEAVLEEIRDLGQEYGSTTGRARQVNWLDYDLLKMAARINGVNNLVFNKMDILEQTDTWHLYNGPELFQFTNREDMEFWLTNKLNLEVNEDMEIFFSGDKEFI